MRLTRLVGLLLTLLMIAPAAASAVTIEQIVSMSKAGVSDAAIVALIERDRSVYALDPAQVVELQQAGVSEAVTVAMIRSADMSQQNGAAPDQTTMGRSEQPAMVSPEPPAVVVYAVPYPVGARVSGRRSRAVVVVPDVATSIRTATVPATSARGIFFTQPATGMFYPQPQTANCPAPPASPRPR